VAAARCLTCEQIVPAVTARCCICLELGTSFGISPQLFQRSSSSHFLAPLTFSPYFCFLVATHPLGFSLSSAFFQERCTHTPSLSSSLCADGTCLGIYQREFLFFDQGQKAEVALVAFLGAVL
jgi:hypothetical protein